MPSSSSDPPSLSGRRDAERAQAAALNGDFSEAAAGFIAQAERARASGDLATSARCFLAAVRLHLMAGQTLAARAALAEVEDLAFPPAAREAALTTAEVADADGDLEERRRAWTRVLDLQDARARLTAYEKLSRLARDTGDLTTALVHLDAATALADAESDDRARAAFRLEKAVVLTAAQRTTEARRMLDEAEVMASGHAPHLHARIAGQRGLVAFAGGDTAEAIRLGQIARASAVQRADVETYLSSTVLISSAYHQDDRPVDELDTLLRAKSSLTDLLGDNGQALIEPALTALETRLGPARFAEVHAAWAARRRAEINAGG